MIRIVVCTSSAGAGHLQDPSDLHNMQPLQKASTNCTCQTGQITAQVAQIILMYLPNLHQVQVKLYRN